MIKAAIEDADIILDLQKLACRIRRKVMNSTSRAARSA